MSECEDRLDRIWNDLSELLDMCARAQDRGETLVSLPKLIKQLGIILGDSAP